jgi:hypothetical protein
MFQHPAKARNDREDKILRKEKKREGKRKTIEQTREVPSSPTKIRKPQEWWRA